MGVPNEGKRSNQSFARGDVEEGELVDSRGPSSAHQQNEAAQQSTGSRRRGGSQERPMSNHSYAAQREARRHNGRPGTSAPRKRWRHSFDEDASDRKRSAHNPAREPLVVNPPFFILKGFPRFWSEKDRLWQVPGDSGNPELTQTLSAFKDDLESGVKVQYARGGAFGEGLTGVAVARFKNHFRARDVSGLFETNGIGKRAWLARKQHSAREDEHKIYGWLAEREDMLQLPNKDKNGKDRIKWNMIPLASVPDQQLETQIQNAALRERIKEQQRRKDEERRKAEQMRTEAEEFEKKIAALKDTSAAQAKKLEGVRKELDEQGKAYQEKEAELITSLQEDLERVTANLAQEKHAIEETCRLMILQNELKEKIERSKEDMQCMNALLEKQKLERAQVDRANAAQKAWIEKEKQEQDERYSMLKKEREEWNQREEELQRSIQYRELGEIAGALKDRLDTECLLCMKGPEELVAVPEDNDPDYHEKILNARHFFVPCNHSNICGDCALQYLAHERKKGKVPLCPSCKEECTGASPFVLNKWI